MKHYGHLASTVLSHCLQQRTVELERLVQVFLTNHWVPDYDCSVLAS